MEFIASIRKDSCKCVSESKEIQDPGVVRTQSLDEESGTLTADAPHTV